MSKKNSKVPAFIIGPVLTIGGILALWQNETRFNYYEAARDATIITSPYESDHDTIAYTNTLNEEIPIQGDYIEDVYGYLTIDRSAQIYSWQKSTDSDGNTQWSLGWYSHLENNSKNNGLTQTLSSRSLYQHHYELGEMIVSSNDIHFVDSYIDITTQSLNLNTKGHNLYLTERDGYFYLDKDRSDDLGDERIRYDGIPLQSTASYFGKLNNNKAIGKQFDIDKGFINQLIKNDGVLHHLVNGDHGTALATIKSDYKMTVWLTRLFGTIAVIFGISIFLSSFVGLLYRIPILGGLVKGGVFIFSLTFGLIISLTVILFGIIFNNPLTVALPIALLLIGFVYLRRRAKKTSRNAKKILEQQKQVQTSTSARNSQPPPPPPGNNIPGETPTVPPIFPGSELQGIEVNGIERTFIHLVIMAKGDGNIDNKEKKFLSNWAKQNGISSERTNLLLNKASSTGSMDDSITRKDIELLACVALADGDLSKKEWNLLTNYAKKINILPEEVGRIINNIEQGILTT